MIRRYRRAVAPLRRRIFLWFGAAIVLASAVSWAAAHLVGGGSDWRRDIEGMKRFGAARFAEVWDDPAVRRALAEEMAADLRVHVTVRDGDGVVVEQIGEACCETAWLSLEPTRAGKELGRVDLCRTASVRKHLSGIAAFIAALGVLWAVSHKIARRLGRPLESLARATGEIGRGRYDVDVRVHRHAPVEIQRLADAVRDMAERIKRQMADQRELLASVSHEVRSPLARIRLLLELLRDEPAPRDTKEKLYAELEQEIEEIDDLVGGLLASSRVDFSALTLRDNDLVAAARRAIERAGLALEPEARGKPRQVRCDATLVARALANLLDNAAKHGGGARAVVVRFEERRTCFEVHDEGPGFAEGEVDRAFDPFYGKSKGGYESLGLGLALVKRIAQAHGGDAFAESREPRGAIVGFWLPEGADDEASAASSG
jgi:signal transduction histidine kinase